MHGGIKVYRGSGAAARHYVEADRSRADDYYLAEGTGLADRFVVYPDGLLQRPAMDGDTYERWVAGYVVESCKPKGRLRTDDNAVRFVEVVVNGPKSWSLAAAVHPEIAAAYDAAQDRAAVEILRWLAQHSTTRIGPRGRQVQIPVEQLEAARIRHYTSRAGDPYRHTGRHPVAGYGPKGPPDVVAHTRPRGPRRTARPQRRREDQPAASRPQGAAAPHDQPGRAPGPRVRLPVEREQAPGPRRGGS